MADQQNLGALLAALTGQQQRPQSQPPNVHAQLAQNIAAAAGLSGNQQPVPMQGNFSLPQPTSSGAVDLSNIKPVNSGTVSLADAIARAKSIAAERGVAAYRTEQQATRYDDSRNQRGGGGVYGRGRSRSRSRSPPRRDTYRDGYNPYRDERRGRNFERERTYSPPRRNGPYSPPPTRGYAGGQRGSQGGSGNQSGGGGSGSGSGSGSGGANREKNPDTHTEQMHIESGLVGLIIGRGGETLRRVEQETGARVQFLAGGDHRETPERLCNIIGTRSQIAAARQQILQIIEDNAKGSGPNAGGGGPSKRGASGASSHQPPLRDGGSYHPNQVAHKDTYEARSDNPEDSLQIMVPDRTVGLIIGRGGETIRDLQERSGCHINIVGEQKSVNGLRPVNLIGSPECAKRAKDLIMEIVDSDIRSQAAPGGPGPQAPASGGPRDRGHGNVQGGYHEGNYAAGGRNSDKVTETIRVPIDAVGMIIGKGGETIKEMQSSTGCRINVSSQFHPSDTEREISLQGPKDAIMRARKAIEDKVEASVCHSSHVICRIIPVYKSPLSSNIFPYLISHIFVLSSRRFASFLVMGCGRGQAAKKTGMRKAKKRTA
ncbi:hypothetical protein BDZ91DRAFT_425292 [Kalaharituber pfeilii]|nr:hypothetical protein BDZ91DRAFT_425292 [Kalaharituber pfeilii]